MTEGSTARRVRVLAIIVLVMFASLTTRLWFLQVLAAPQFRLKATENAVRLVEVPGPRGQILDRNGMPLVTNRASLQVMVNRQEIGDCPYTANQKPGPNCQKVIDNLSSLLGLKPAVIQSRMNNNQYWSYQPVPVAFDVKQPVAAAIGEHPEDYPGVTTEEVPVRYYPGISGYPGQDLAAHVLGVTYQITKQEYGTPAYPASQGYGPTSVVGQSGLEAQYEKYLHGKPGEAKYLMNASGQIQGQPIGVQAPVAGDNLVLSLDAQAQQLVEQALQAGELRAQASGYPQANAGAAVVLDPTTGQVVAMASSPTYNPNWLVGGIPQTQQKYMGPNNPLAPQFNRAIQGQYASGSTIKPLIGLAAMRAGFQGATPGTTLDCPGQWSPPKQQGAQQTVYNNWTPANLGYINLANAIVMSCDTFFYQLGWDFYIQYLNQPPKGSFAHPGLMQRDLTQFGLGKATGIDIADEATGLVPDAQWKKQAFSPQPGNYCAQRWCPGDNINMSIGQGDLRVTPLQMAVAFSAIYNGGHICQPRLGMKVLAPDGKLMQNIPTDCSKPLPYTQAQLNYMKAAMSGVLTSPNGTATPAFAGFPFSRFGYIGGKTGTAQVPGQMDYSWFGCMANGTDSRGNTHAYTIVVVVERGGHGGTTAAPIARQILDGLYGLPGYPLVIGSDQSR